MKQGDLIKITFQLSPRFIYIQMNLISISGKHIVEPSETISDDVLRADMKPMSCSVQFISLPHTKRSYCIRCLSSFCTTVGSWQVLASPFTIFQMLLETLTVMALCWKYSFRESRGIFLRAQVRPDSFTSPGSTKKERCFLGEKE